MHLIPQQLSSSAVPGGVPNLLLPLPSGLIPQLTDFPPWKASTTIGEFPIHGFSSVSARGQVPVPFPASTNPVLAKNTTVPEVGLSSRQESDVKKTREKNTPFSAYGFRPYIFSSQQAGASTLSKSEVWTARTPADREPYIKGSLRLFIMLEKKAEWLFNLIDCLLIAETDLRPTAADPDSSGRCR